MYGPDIHKKLALRWLPLLKKGIEKDAKDKFLKEYAIPSNCKLLKAPTLNAEISAAVPEGVRARDKILQNRQDQLGLGITAINRAINLLLTGDDKVHAVKILSDSCRILSDLHYAETQVRIKLIIPSLEKSFTATIQDQDRDETLFGNKLPEKIKASKAIEKRGLQIKKGPSPKPTTSGIAPSGGHLRQQGNWKPPPRSSWISRGGAYSSVPVTGAATVPPCTALADAELASTGAGAADQTCPNALIPQVHAGRLQQHYECWKNVTKNSVIIDWIRNGYCIPFSKKVIQTNVPTDSFTTKERYEMSAAIENLLHLGAIEKCEARVDQFISSIFLADKGNGGRRFILNLKRLNKNINKVRFKMEDFRTASKMTPYNGLMATIDLKEAYLLVPIAKSSRKYLRFRFDNDL